MNQINLPQPQPQPGPGAAPHSTGRRSLLWVGITALTAAVAFSIAVPRLIGHGNVHAGAMPVRITGSTTWDSSVPAASDVFVEPESGTVVSEPAPTF